jgi:uncharacterized protein YbaP (TraB family)
MDMRSLLRFAALLVLTAAPAAALALPPVWTVRDKDSTMVLFGSVHVLPPGLDWRPHELQAALAQADDIWFEAPMDAAGQSAATQAALAHGFLPANQKLTPMLSAAGRARLAKAARDIGVNVEQFDRLEPWYAELLIETSVYQKVGARGSDGVEEQLWAGVPANAQRHEFETPEQQVGFFANAAMKDQLASLEETLRESGDAEKEYDVLLKAWLAGDLKTLDKEVVRPLRKASPNLYETLVVQRNERWVKALAQRMAGSGRTVVIVGMGHLIGPDGLPARLRAMGYEVEGPR